MFYIRSISLTHLRNSCNSPFKVIYLKNLTGEMCFIYKQNIQLLSPFWALETLSLYLSGIFLLLFQILSDELLLTYSPIHVFGHPEL